MKYLVTGGAGFIGSNIVRRLLRDGHTVRVLDNFSSGKRENLEDIQAEIEILDGDIRDYWTCVRATRGIEIVLHQAALPSVPRSVDNPLTSSVVNIDGMLNMLESSRQAGVKRLVFASSSSVYGETEELPKREAMIPSPLSPYAVSKMTNELYGRVYSNLYKFPTVALRYFNIFGPRQDPKSEYAAVVPRFITAFMSGNQPIVFGDGEQSRDFTFIDNCVQANLLAATSDKMVGRAFNVGCGGQFTLNQLLDNLRKIMGVKIEAQYAPARAGDIKHSFAAIEQIKECGYNPSVGFVEGLQRTVEYFTSLPGRH